MATVKQLLRNPGPYITALLPDVQELVKLDNPYITNEVARLIWNHQITWGHRGRGHVTVLGSPPVKATGGEMEDGMSWYSRYAAQTSDVTTKYADAVIVKNFALKIDGLPSAASNSWLEFQKFIDLFYQLLDPVTFFTQELSECPPDYLEPCKDVLNNFYVQRIGMYERPMTNVGTEGTGFYFANPIKGDPTTKQVVQVGFTAPYPHTDPHALALNNRYFVMNYNAAADDWDVIWYDYQGTGVQPVFTGGAGTINYHPVVLTSDDEWPEILAKTTVVVEATTRWVDSITTCKDRDGNIVPCPWKFTAQYEADVIGARQDARDGDGGYLTPETTMYASDTTEMANGLVTDEAWQNAHNDLRVPYEKLTFDNDYMYLKSIKALDDNDAIPYCEGCSYCPDPCIMKHMFLQTIAIGVINEIPVNVPGVLNNNGAGNERLKVVD
jgi:hypothetical protein